MEIEELVERLKEKSKRGCLYHGAPAMDDLVKVRDGQFQKKRVCEEGAKTIQGVVR